MFSNISRSDEYKKRLCDSIRNEYGIVFESISLAPGGFSTKALNSIVSQHTDLLISAIRKAYRLRDTIQSRNVPLVLCHGDAHGNNVIQGECLVLADWEDHRLAPAEADLFIHAWHPHSDLFLESYSDARHGYQINHELLFFYVLRRRIEDVWVDIQRLTEESPGEAETAKLLVWTRLGIEEIHGLMLDI